MEIAASKAGSDASLYAVPFPGHGHQRVFGEMMAVILPRLLEIAQGPPVPVSCAICASDPLPSTLEAIMTDSPNLTPSAAGLSITSGRASLTILGPLPENHPFYEKIGRVAASWARLEHTLDLMIWELAKGEQPAISCITSQIMGSSGRFRAIKALCELRHVSTAVATEINNLDRPIFQTSLKRNRLVHDAWYMEQSDEKWLIAISNG